MPFSKNTQSVRKAVIPAAGLGTRFLPVTRAVPKALLPVLNKPLIHYVAEEAAASGIREVALILGPGMDAVAEYFTDQPILESTLRQRGHTDLLHEQRGISDLVDITVIIQHTPHGLGHAVLLAKEFIGNETFAVLLPDDLIWGNTPAIEQILAVRKRYGGSVIGAREVPLDLVSKFGIIDGHLLESGVFEVKRLVEKPKPQHAPSNIAIVGRYVLEPRVLDHLANTKPGAGGEVQLTDAIAAMIGESPVHACAVEGRHADAGVPAGLLQAALYEARKDPALREAVMATVAAWQQDNIAS
ncbi:MAG: UTP--glucose-1-phosphate uridylyltransferase [Dehalococcoidia bacterium]|nr:UTP--glucose-1-phosphate uridylyltransferase [Dehalococcoidia bacterium]MSQ35153.1 UTP--glucose-1-phosphate uridylyltransferase [Dehalococcoidia bacterium]